VERTRAERRQIMQRALKIMVEFAFYLNCDEKPLRSFDTI
jgi:hypothetical protein